MEFHVDTLYGVGSSVDFQCPGPDDIPVVLLGQQYKQQVCTQVTEVILLTRDAQVWRHAKEADLTAWTHTGTAGI
jgi:hypothetical protein